jgi:hypothetical protein
MYADSITAAKPLPNLPALQRRLLAHLRHKKARFLSGNRALVSARRRELHRVRPVKTLTRIPNLYRLFVMRII